MELDNERIKKIFKNLATTEKQNVKDMLLNYSKEEKSLEVQVVEDDDSWKHKEIKQSLNIKPINALSDTGYITPVIKDYLLSNYKEPFFSEKPFESNTYLVKRDGLPEGIQRACLSIHAVRIVLILSFLLRERHVKMMKDENQLSLFDSEWFNTENDTILAVQVRFKYADFLPKGCKDNNLIREALEELYSKRWVVEYPMIIGGRVRKVLASRGLISDFVVDDNGMKLIINNYWYRSLINISKSYYINLNKEAIFSLSERTLLFYIYINTLPFLSKETDTEGRKAIQEFVKELGINNITSLRGTIISKENFLMKFAASEGTISNERYKYNSNIETTFLKPFKKELSKNKLDKNFNYKFDERGNIIIVVFEMISYEVRKELITNEQAELKATISYIKKYRELTNFETICIANYFLQYSYNTIMKATQNKKALRGLKGKQYVVVFSSLVNKYVDTNKKELEELDRVYNKIDNESRNEMRKYFSEKYPNTDEL